MKSSLILILAFIISGSANAGDQKPVRKIAQSANFNFRDVSSFAGRYLCGNVGVVLEVPERSLGIIFAEVTMPDGSSTQEQAAINIRKAGSVTGFSMPAAHVKIDIKSGAKIIIYEAAGLAANPQTIECSKK